MNASKENSSKQQQHYVPRVLLSQFSAGNDRNRVFVYDKHVSRSFGPVTVDKICKEGGFYVTETANGKVSIEEAFHPLEDAYGKIAPKIIETKTLSSLSATEFVNLVTFVCVQFLRVPRVRIAFEQISQLIVDKAKAMAMLYLTYPRIGR